MQRKILVAENDHEQLDLYQQFFQHLGFEVIASSSGLECLEHLRRNPPAVLVLDDELVWGGADGLLAWLREESLGDRVAVVLMATRGTLVVEGHPVVACLQKPFGLSALLRSVNSAFGAMTPGDYQGLDWLRQPSANFRYAAMKWTKWNGDREAR